MDFDKIRRKVMAHEDKPGFRLTRTLWLQGSILNCDLSESIIKNVVFYDVNFEDVSLVGAHLTKVRFVECTLNSTNLIRATLIDCSFENCDLYLTNLSMSTIMETELTNCRTHRTELSDAKVSNLEGWLLFKEIDSRKNLLIYNETERIVSHAIISGTPEDCVRRLWESETIAKKYSEELVSLVVKLSRIKIGINTLK